MAREPTDSNSHQQQPAAGLLGAVLCNRDLRRQLDRMPADEKTIELSTDDGSDFTHPAWKAGPVDSSEFPTIEVPTDPVATAVAPVDQGFVPKRRLASISEKKHENTDYRIVGQLGSGGTGIVYQAHQRAVDREVAVKILREELAFNQLSRQRFLAEARVIGGLDHPNVIALHEVCVDEGGGLFYSMKRIDGASWDKQIAEMPLGANIGTLLRVADAIRYAHSRGLIHRDIKPENVMLGRFGEVLVADWGLAISHDSEESAIGIKHSIGGTPAYMAPELASGMHHKVCYQTDVYLLGAVLFQILTGYPPHQGKSLLACIHAAAHNEIRPAQVDGELMEIAMQAMATDPADRFASVEDFVNTIRSQRKHEDSTRLVRRACDRLARATDAKQYEDYRIAEALLMEAIDVWPDNRQAHEARKRLQMAFAKSATIRGDLDLALSIYETAGESDSAEAQRVRELRSHREDTHRRHSRYSTLFTQSPEAGLLIDLSGGVVVEANEAFARLFGYEEDEVVDQTIAQLNLWADPERRGELVEQLQQTGAIENFEAVFRNKSGQKIDVLISGRVVEVQGVKMVVSMIRDISLRKRAENEVYKHRQRLRDLQRLAGLATWSYDVASGEVNWSEEAFLLAGRSIDQGVPSKEEFFNMIHPEDRPAMKETIEAAIDSGSAYELVIRQRGPRGKYKRVVLRGQPIFDEDGRTVEVYGVMIPQKV